MNLKEISLDEYILRAERLRGMNQKDDDDELDTDLSEKANEASHICCSHEMTNEEGYLTCHHCGISKPYTLLIDPNERNLSGKYKYSVENHFDLLIPRYVDDIKFPINNVRAFHMMFVRWFQKEYPRKNILPMKFLMKKYSELYNFKIKDHPISQKSLAYYDKVFNLFLESPIEPLDEF